MPADPSDLHRGCPRAYNNLNLAEKALQTVSLFKELDFPKTHSIVRLLDIIESSGVVIPEIVESADRS